MDAAGGVAGAVWRIVPYITGFVAADDLALLAGRCGLLLLLGLVFSLSGDPPLLRLPLLSPFAAPPLPFFPFLWALAPSAVTWLARAGEAAPLTLNSPSTLFALAVVDKSSLLLETPLLLLDGLYMGLRGSCESRERAKCRLLWPCLVL